MTIASKPFNAVRPGDVYPSVIPAGEKLAGRLAEIARQLGAVDDPKAAPRTKAARGAPETK